MADRNVRYGAEIRKRAAKVYGQKTSKYECPACGKAAVKRSSYSKWECGACKSVFAGGAFSFTTPSGQVSKRIVEG
ncbi:MAG: 50S ribosomal protein L37ae [Candidatus Micrarchaeia archaeon]